MIFRLAQGAFGASLAPLSQAVLMDINPRERQGQAMAMWGAGIMIAPIIGPTLGAYLTDHLNWRWVFYINLPIGILAFLGMLFFMPETPEAHPPLRLLRLRHAVARRRLVPVHARPRLRRSTGSTRPRS